MHNGSAFIIASVWLWEFSVQKSSAERRGRPIELRVVAVIPDPDSLAHSERQHGLTAAWNPVVIVNARPDFFNGLAVLHQIHEALSFVAPVVCSHNGDVEDVGSCVGGYEYAGAWVVGAAVVGDDVIKVHDVTSVVGCDCSRTSHEID